MRIDSSGNVGIGTTSPSYPLDVVGPIRINHVGSDTFATIRGPGNRDLRIDIDANGDTDSFLVRDLRDGSERFKVQAGGNVGIGTSSPDQTLHVHKGSAGTVSSQANSVLTLENNTSAILQFLTPNTADQQIRFGDPQDNGAGYMNYSHAASALTFGVNGPERMRIDSSGNVLVGTTTEPSSSGSGSGFVDTSFGRNQLRLAHTDNTGGSRSLLVFYGGTAGNLVGTVTASNTTTTYNTTSDQRLKENIVDAPAGNIDAIRVRSFDWKADGSHQTYGMVAQELVEVAPEVVTQGETEDDMWSVDYSKLVPMMIKEIQDLKAEVAALKGA
jgi:hypothetical protein